MKEKKQPRFEVEIPLKWWHWLLFVLLIFLLWKIVR